MMTKKQFNTLVFLTVIIAMIGGTLGLTTFCIEPTTLVASLETSLELITGGPALGAPNLTTREPKAIVSHVLTPTENPPALQPEDLTNPIIPGFYILPGGKKEVVLLGVQTFEGTMQETVAEFIRTTGRQEQTERLQKSTPLCNQEPRRSDKINICIILPTKEGGEPP